ncbi:hypothetical protein ACLBWT_11145 [Paenibacillus sp. D51F]
MLAHKVLMYIEWTVLTVSAAMLLLLLIPSLGVFFPAQELKAARSEGRFHAAEPASSRYFYGKWIRVRGAAVHGTELEVFIDAKGFPRAGGPSNGLAVKVVSDSGKDLMYQGSSSSRSLFGGGMMATYDGLPEGAKYVIVSRESYGQSFSYRIPLAKGGTRS